jgi:hypothetical protein
MTVLREERSKGSGHTFVQGELGHRLCHGRLTGVDSLCDLLLEGDVEGQVVNDQFTSAKLSHESPLAHHLLPMGGRSLAPHRARSLFDRSLESANGVGAQQGRRQQLSA